MQDQDYHNHSDTCRILTTEEKEEICIDLSRISDSLMGIDGISITYIANEETLRQVLACLPLFAEKLLHINERLAEITEISVRTHNCESS